MRAVMYRMEDYLLYDYAGVERHLSVMAARGWRLEAISDFLWKYRRAEPAKLTYAVTYAPDASTWNLQPTEQQQRLIDYCAAAGWHKVTDWLQMQIFCTTEETPIPLETDEALRLEITREAMWSKFLLMKAGNLFLLLVIAGVLLLSFAGNPILHLSKGYLLALDVFVLYGIFQSGIHLGSYCWWSYRSEKLVEQGGSCAVPLPYLLVNKIGRIGTAVFLLAFVLLFLQDRGKGPGLYAVLYLLFFFVMRFLLQQMQKFFKQKGLSKGQNIFALVLLDFLLAFLLIGGLTYYTLQAGWFTPQTVTQEELLITLEDLQDVSGLEYHQQKNIHSSILLARFYGEQWKGQTTDLEYEMIEVKWPVLYDWCLQQYLQKNESFTKGGAYQALEGNFQQTVYQYYMDDKPINQWLLCKENCILKLSTSWSLTEAQLQVVEEKLQT